MSCDEWCVMLMRLAYFEPFGLTFRSFLYLIGDRNSHFCQLGASRTRLKGRYELTGNNLSLSAKRCLHVAPIGRQLRI